MSGDSATKHELKGRMETMLKWIREAGVTWNDKDLIFDVEVGSGGSGGILVSARRDLEPNMGLARIPKAACLSVLNVVAVHSRLEAFDLEDDADIALAAAITHEILLGAKSKWHGYLSSLSPDGESVPLVWSEDTLLLLQGTGMEEEVDQDRQRFAYYWTNYVRPLLEDALGKKKVPEGTAFHAFLRAVTWSNSRGFYVDERHLEAMVPFADLFNHKAAYLPLEYEVWTVEEAEGEEGEEEEVGVDDTLDVDEACDVTAEADKARVSGHEQTMCLASSADSDADELVVGLLRPVAKGAEIYNTYGEHGNKHLLANYGFTLPHNVFDQVALPALLDAANEIAGEQTVRKRVRWLESLLVLGKTQRMGAAARAEKRGKGAKRATKGAQRGSKGLDRAGHRVVSRVLRAGLVGFVVQRRYCGVCPLGARVFRYSVYLLFLVQKYK